MRPSAAADRRLVVLSIMAAFGSAASLDSSVPGNWGEKGEGKFLQWAGGLPPQPHPSAAALPPGW
jgi:hypothetical protein